METALMDPTFHAGLVKIMGREPDEFVPGRKLDEIANSFSVKDLDAVLRKYKVGYKSPF
jgi:hypothetical protein